jgi:N-acetylglutamate synthase-like GNAT family acetyltransferase
MPAHARLIAGVNVWNRCDSARVLFLTTEVERMIRPCSNGDFEAIWEIINDGASAYNGVIPKDCWHEPYMSREQLRREMNDGVTFSAWELDGQIVGVMGLQNVQDVVLIRHAYVRTKNRNQGIGGKLLQHLLAKADKPVLIGTWADARWAIAFYEKHGFKVVDQQTKNRLLKQYWNIPQRQLETSVVLADARWLSQNQHAIVSAG